MKKELKNSKLVTVAALAGLTLGGFGLASAASAQSYGGQSDAAVAETSETVDAAQSDQTLETDADGRGRNVRVQNPDGTETEGERGGRRGHRGHGGGCNLEEAAAAIGIDEADLRAAIESGSSIADVAEANGVSVDAVIDALVEDKTADIAEKVEEGRITAEEADEKLAELEAKITDRVNGVDDADRSESDSDSDDSDDSDDSEEADTDA